MKLTKKLLTLLFLILSFNSIADELITLNTRDGVQQKFILMTPDKPVASVILFAGGNGILELSGSSSINQKENNFLVRSRDKFVEQGFITAIVDAPSDAQEKPGMSFGFRDSDEHMTDMDHVIRYLKKQTKLPVWLIGTSRGTESAANVAIESKQKPHGLVLTSSMSVENAKGTAVNEMELEKIKIPTLIVAHEDDGCHVTPPEASQEIKEMLTNAKKVEVKIFSGGSESGKACKGSSYHGFEDIEESVVNYIANFIKEN